MKKSHLLLFTEVFVGLLCMASSYEVSEDMGRVTFYLVRRTWFVICPLNTSSSGYSSSTNFTKTEGTVANEFPKLFWKSGENPNFCGFMVLNFGNFYDTIFTTSVCVLPVSLFLFKLIICTDTKLRPTVLPKIFVPIGGAKFKKSLVLF